MAIVSPQINKRPFSNDAQSGTHRRSTLILPVKTSSHSIAGLSQQHNSPGDSINIALNSILPNSLGLSDGMKKSNKIACLVKKSLKQNQAVGSSTYELIP